MPTASNRMSLILGGARSGKSTFAEALVMREPAPWIYIATAETFDAEMAERIAEHRRRRGPQWTTIEAPRDLAGLIEHQVVGGAPVLVDCLTLWLSNVMLADLDVAAQTDRLVTTLEVAAGQSARIVLVSNEVGLGIVPDNALGRRFRDAQGRLNQRVATLAGHVVFMAAGLPMVLKTGGG